MRAITRLTGAIDRRLRKARRTAAAGLTVGLLLSGIAVVGSTAPAGAAGGTSCAAADLKPSLHELMVSQGLPSFTQLVRGKETLIRLFLSKPQCASRTQSVTITGATVAVTNASVAPAAALGTGTQFSPTGPYALPAYYTGTPPTNSPTDPIFTVKGNVLTPCGAAASCPTDTAAFDASFTVTLSYTATGVTGTQTVVFAATKPVAQKSNALRVLVVPMGDASQLLSTQYSASADAAVQQGFNTLSRLLPVPCNADPADATGACFASSLQSAFGGVRYAVNPGVLDLRAVPGAYDSTGRFCGTQSNWDAIKATLAQHLQSWNTLNPDHSADRVVGVVDEAISNGVGTSPAGFSCADGMAATGSVAAWSRAMYTTQPSRTGGILAMELEHTFGGVPFPRSTTTHSANSAADLTAPGRAYNLIQRAYLASSRSAMKYDTTLPWNNDTTLLEPPDQALLLCHLGGPPNTECTTSGTTGAVTGAGVGITVVGSFTTRLTPETTTFVMSYRTDDVKHFDAPDPVGPCPDCSLRVVTRGPNPLNLGIKGSASDTDHSGEGNNVVSDGHPALLSFALPGQLWMSGFAIYHCPTGSDACKADPAANGGVTLFERDQLPSPTVVGDVSFNEAGNLRNWTADPSRQDTNAAINGDAVAWEAPCGSCPNAATTVHLAPAADVDQVVEIPSATGQAQHDASWSPDGGAVVFSEGGNLYTALVDRTVTPFVVSAVTRIYAQGGNNPAAVSPTWSCNGIVYFGAANGGIRLVPAAGGKSSPLIATPAKEGEPSASLDCSDNRLSYTRTVNGAKQVAVVNPAHPQNTQTLVIANADQPWFGADGRIVVRQAGKLLSVLPDGTDRRQLTDGPDDANPTTSAGVLGLDRGSADRDVWLADLGARSLSATVTGPDLSRVTGQIVVTCPDGSHFPVAVGTRPNLRSQTQGTFEANFDGSLTCGGTVTVAWWCSDGFDVCVQGAGSQLDVPIPEKAPVASITSPRAGLVISPTGTLPLNGSASSLQGQLSGASLEWFTHQSPDVLRGTGNTFDLPAPIGGWASGPLTVTLKATDADGRTSTASTVVTVDGVAPTVEVTSAPADPNPSSTATVTFSVSDTGGSGQTTTLCQLDDGEPTPCSSSVTYSDLTPGEHTVIVWSTDEAGNETHQVIVWTQEDGGPTTVVDDAPLLCTSLLGCEVTGTATDASGVASVTVHLRNLATQAVTSLPATCAGCGIGGTSVTWSVDPTSAGVGLYAVTATAIDVAGNTGPPSNEIPLEITLI